MILLLSNGTAIENVSCSDKLLEVPFLNYSDLPIIYTKITNETLNGSHWETSTGAICGRYENVSIKSAITENNIVRFILENSFTEKERELMQKIEDLEKNKEENEEKISELQSVVIDLVNMLLEV